MIFLLGSILCSTFLTIAFKFCDRFGISKFQAIVFNYLTCLITGSVVNGSFPSLTMATGESWFAWALVMGVGFVISFNLIAVTVQRSGLAIASVASKLSLVIPFIASILLYQESTSFLKVLGIVLALVAVALTIYTPAADAQFIAKRSTEGAGFLLPLVVFVFTGVLDSLVKYVEQAFLNDANNNEFLIIAFLAAFVGGFAFFIAGISRGKMRFCPKAIVAGICIGIPNYFSIWCLVKVLKLYPRESATLLPVNNLGIVLCSALIAWVLYKEQLHKINWLGIVLALIAICLVAFG